MAYTNTHTRIRTHARTLIRVQVYVDNAVVYNTHEHTQNARTHTHTHTHTHITYTCTLIII